MALSGSCALQLGDGVGMEPGSCESWLGRLTATDFTLPLWGTEGDGTEVL